MRIARRTLLVRHTPRGAADESDESGPGLLRSERRERHQRARLSARGVQTSARVSLSVLISDLDMRKKHTLQAIQDSW